MLILVTGAAGRIGAHLTRLLVASGHHVRGFVLPGDPRTELIRFPGVELWPGRLEDEAALTAAADGVEAIYHLGGALTSRYNSDQEFFDLNVRSTFTLLMAARAAGSRLRRFVYASSDAVYLPSRGASPSFLPIEETHPRLAASIYGASKVAAEDLCFSFWRGFGVPAIVLRFGATADADELTNPHSVFARWLFVREAIAHLERTTSPGPEVSQSIQILRALDNPRQDGPERVVIFADLEGRPEVRQWGDARDVAVGCARVLEVEEAIGQAFNLGGVAPFSAAELGHHQATRLGLEAVTARLPIARGAWYTSSAKARGILGYAPRYTVFDMVDETAGVGMR
jgi:nucleoside-diphosphate-sugar epimerase